MRHNAVITVATCLAVGTGVRDGSVATAARYTLLEKLEWTFQLSTVSRAEAAGPIDVQFGV